MNASRPVNLPACPSLLALFLQQVVAFGDKPFLWRKVDGRYDALSWRQVSESVAAAARGLRKLGLAKGDRVVLVGENRPEWLIADLAIIAAGGVTVPAYTTNTVEDHRHVIEHSGAIGIIVSTHALARKVSAAAAQAPDCRWLVTMADEPLDVTAGQTTHRWAEVIASSGGEPDLLADAAKELNRSDIAGFIYTSGTGGRPKAVMLTHGSALANLHGAYSLLAPYGLKDEVFLSFLPPSHAYERTLGQFLPIAIGAQIYYGEGIEHLARNIEESKPTLLACVPRMLDAMRQRIERAVDRQGGLKVKLFHETHRLGVLRQREQLGFIDGLFDRVLEKLVREKFRARFGGSVKAFVSAGAALDPDVGRFFTAMGVLVLQGYGQTEAGPMISGNSPGDARMDSVGRPIETVEVRIADDGEILVRGEGVMRGYWRDDEATAAAIHDGWLHTGDIGVIDPDGHLRITDRKKDIIVLAGGDNVSPARVEGLITREDSVAQAVVFGDDRQSGLTAVLVPDAEYLKSLPDKSERGIRESMGKAIDSANGSLAPYERVRSFVVSPTPFTIDNGMMTPTLKIRRHLVKEMLGNQLEPR